jgi:formate hydrogenlyase transcriptional activator
MDHGTKRAEDPLPGIELRWRAVFENCSIGIAMAGIDGRLGATNSAFRKLMGFTEEDLPAECSLFTELVKENGGDFKIEKHHRRKDGSLIWLNISVSLVPPYQGTSQIMIALIEDITERKRAVEAWHDSEKRFRTILDSGPNIIFLKDPEGRYLYVNKEFQRAFRVSQEQAEGKKDDEIFPHEQAAAFQANDVRVFQTAVPMEFEEVALQEDGLHTSIVQKFPLLNAEGKIYAIGGFVTDITQRKRAEKALKQSEERFRLLVEGVQNCAIFALDPEGRVIAWNAGAERIKGYRAEEILGQHFSRFYEAADIERGEPEQELEMAAAAGHFETEGWRVRKDGSRFWANVILTLIRDNDGKLLGFSKVTRDLTERKRFEQELKHERDRLRLLLDLNNSFASNLDLGQLFRAVSACVRSIMRSDATILSLPELETNQIRMHAIDFPQGKGFIKEGFVHPIEGSVEGLVYRTAKPTVFNRLPTWLNPKLQELLTKEGLKSGCALPLIRRGRTLGILSLACLQENAFTQQDVDLLEQVADQVAIAVENALRYHQVTESSERLAKERLYLEDEIRRERNFDEIIGKSPALKRVLKEVETVAATNSAVLLLGETGTGKELIARAIHKISSRRNRTLVRADCASIPPGLLESELFGHEKGAFTGAIAREIGRFELAHEGTLFLDEVGDIPLGLQSKLLRVLQEQELERLGSTRTIRVDFRLVAATNRDLKEMVEHGQFRSDLYYRLNVFPIEVPPLRDRPEDIPVLVWHFANRCAQRMNKQIENIRAEDMEALAHYHWPGNVRELQNVIERCVILTSNAVLFCPLVAELERVGRNAPPEVRSLEQAEREHILRTLEKTDWVIGGPHGAAALLAVRRTTLLYKMRRLGISRPEHGAA